MIRWLSPPATAAVVVLLAATPAAAHAELRSTTPEAGAQLDAPPEEVVLVFDGELDPEGSGFAVTDAAGAEVGAGGVDLEVAERNELRGPVEIADPGTYTVTWSVVGADGHVVEGSYAFSVGNPDAAGDEGDTPDTALAAGGGTGWLVPVGIALLVAGSYLAGVRSVAAVRDRR